LDESKGATHDQNPELQMRVPLIKQADLTEEQVPLFEDMKQGIAANFQGFTNIGTDGALLGPWNVGQISAAPSIPIRAPIRRW
jgi:hypothetical protein